MRLVIMGAGFAGIYPPRAERAAALASADPERMTNL
jgi:hypothetical protein